MAKIPHALAIRSLMYTMISTRSNICHAMSYKHIEF